MVFTIGSGNYFFTHRIVDYLSDLDSGSASFLWFQKITLAIAIIPIVVLTLWAQIYLLKKNLKAAFGRYESVGFMKDMPEFIIEIMATYPESIRCNN